MGKGIMSGLEDQSKLKIETLGGLQISRGGNLVSGWASRKAEALVVYLAISQRTHSRESLATLFWEDFPQTRAMTNLRVVLTSLRKQIGDFLITPRGTVALNLTTDIWVDTLEIDKQLSRANNEGLSPLHAKRISDSLALFKGDFLEGFHVRAGLEFEHWVTMERERLRQTVQEGLQTLVTFYLHNGDYKAGISPARQLLQINPLYEAGHRDLMRLLAYSEQRAAALDQYQACQNILRRDLALEPAAATKTLYEQIRQGKLPSPETRPPITKHNLPADLTPFFGRTAELAKVAAFLSDPDIRLISILGPGGSGKTRLARKAAQAQIDTFADGVFGVPLVGINAIEHIVPAIGEAIQFSFYPGAPPEEQLLNYLRGKQMLLILDNCEHLIAGAEIITQILQSARGVKIVVTSRQKLNQRGELPIYLRGLDYPLEKEELRSPQNQPLSQYPALQLFESRLRRANPEYVFDPDAQKSAAHICQLVDGLPLGIELAASWTEVFTLSEIAAEITRSLGFLETEANDKPDRHRSLQAVFDHTWRLLDEGDRETFKKLSIFRGGFTRTALQEVTGAKLTTMVGLVYKSLLQRQLSGRYEIHELMRQYAAEKLAQNPAALEQALKTHAEYYAEYLNQNEASIRDGSLGPALQDIDNLRASWRQLVTQNNWPAIHKSVLSLSWIYEMKSWFPEETDTFIWAVEILGETDSVTDNAHTFGYLLTFAAHAAQRTGQFERSVAFMNESIRILRDLEAHEELAFAYCIASIIGYFSDPTEAYKRVAQSISIFKSLDISWGAAFGLNSLGDITSYGLGNYAEAPHFYREALEINRKSDSRRGIAWSLAGLAAVAFFQGDYVNAKRYWEESIDLFQEVGYKWMVGSIYKDFAQIAEKTGDFKEAQRHYCTVLEIFYDIGVQSSLTDYLQRYAQVLDLDGQSERAVELATLILNHPHSSAEVKTKTKSLLNGLRSKLSPDDFISAQQIGNSHELEKTVKAILSA